MTTPTPPEAAAGDGHQEGAGALEAGGRLVRSGVTHFAQQSLGDVIDPATASQQLASLMDAHAYRDLVGE